VREPRPHGLDDRLLGGEAHREEALGARGERELRLLLRHEEVLDETVAEALERLGDACTLQHVDADAEDHVRASRIRAFISRTAAGSPTNSACARSAWPMLSSAISRTAATGCTFW
jgi:hypothetical protein